ncbi:MAG: glycosyltransferase [Candidatus Pacebacteria bacterium]|nr:glycosyltransferase [Candidatus Paceibacterota bacterium]
MKKEKKLLLSIIVPAYRQEKTIKKDLRRIEKVLEQIRYDYEIICVVDGRVDKTFEKAREIHSKNLKIVGYQGNKGKGYAVRYGMARSRGDLIAFIDAGMEIDPNGISMVLEHMEWYRADIIVGSKRHPASQIDYPLNRRIISRLYQLFVRFFTGLNITDTQAGLKIFRREVLKAVLPRLLVKRYAFDLEILTVAHHLGFRRIFEAPVKINYRVEDLTHANTLREMARALQDSLAIIYRLRILRYYDSYHKRQQLLDPNLSFQK